MSDTARVRVSVESVVTIRRGVFRGFCDKHPECVAEVDHEGPCCVSASSEIWARP